MLRRTSDFHAGLLFRADFNSSVYYTDECWCDTWEEHSLLDGYTWFLLLCQNKLLRCTWSTVCYNYYIMTRSHLLIWLGLFGRSHIHVSILTFTHTVSYCCRKIINDEAELLLPPKVIIFQEQHLLFYSPQTTAVWATWHIEKLQHVNSSILKLWHWRLLPKTFNISDTKR